MQLWHFWRASLTPYDSRGLSLEAVSIEKILLRLLGERVRSGPYQFLFLCNWYTEYTKLNRTPACSYRPLRQNSYTSFYVSFVCFWVDTKWGRMYRFWLVRAYGSATFRQSGAHACALMFVNVRMCLLSNYAGAEPGMGKSTLKCISIQIQITTLKNTIQLIYRRALNSSLHTLTVYIWFHSSCIPCDLHVSCATTQFLVCRYETQAENYSHIYFKIYYRCITPKRHHTSLVFKLHSSCASVKLIIYKWITKKSSSWWPEGHEWETYPVYYKAQAETLTLGCLCWGYCTVRFGSQCGCQCFQVTVAAFGLCVWNRQSFPPIPRCLSDQALVCFITCCFVLNMFMSVQIFTSISIFGCGSVFGRYPGTDISADNLNFIYSTSSRSDK